MSEDRPEPAAADGYDGRVTVGGPAQTRHAGPLSITKLAVGALDNNAYFLASGGEVLLIDAAAEPDRLLATLEALSDPPRLVGIVTTHRHGDHWQALPEVVPATGAPVIAHRLDAEALPIPHPRTVDDGDTVTVGAARLEVIHLVGHTPGSIALLWRGPDRPHLFTGDCLFPGGVGRTTTPEEFASLYAGVTSKIFHRLPDDTWVYPGHGPDTTLGAERPELESWRARGW